VIGSLLVGAFGWLFLKSGLAGKLAGLFSRRIAERLSIWHGDVANAQLASYFDVLRHSGWLGFCGAARSALLTPAASKDLILGAVSGQAGFVGVAMVTIATCWYLMEIGKAVAGCSSPFRQAASCAGLLTLAAGALVAYLPVTGLLMPATGMPIPGLSRGAAVATAASLLLVGIEWLTSGEEVRR